MLGLIHSYFTDPREIAVCLNRRCFHDGILCGMCGIHAAAFYLKLSLHLKLSLFQPFTVKQMSTIQEDWHLQHINYACIYKNEETLQRQIYKITVLWLLKTMHWIAMVTGALLAGERVIIIAYITLFFIRSSQGVACSGHCHCQQ